MFVPPILDEAQMLPPPTQTAMDGETYIEYWNNLSVTQLEHFGRMVGETKGSWRCDDAEWDPMTMNGRLRWTRRVQSTKFVWDPTTLRWDTHDVRDADTSRESKDG
jgi:hypothetical protein